MKKQKLDTKKEKKQIIVSGIQPSNKITLGNYLGAISLWSNLQNKYSMFLFIADLHSITVDFDPNELNQNKKNALAIYEACGVDLTKNNVFYQSDVLQHTTLGHILLCHTTLGELNRMTQFKDKSVKNANNTTYIPTGLLTYPTLMAADILLYDADYVIVGKDQKQHVELTRNIADRFNKKYNVYAFSIPEPFIGQQNAKIMDLLDPTSKMSKSNKNENGTIFMLDDEETVLAKITKAKTDSLNKVKYDLINQPGISNLINIYCALTKKTIIDVESEFANIANYGQFKKAVALVISKTLAPIQEKYYYNIKHIDKLEQIIENNAKYCSKIAQQKINDVYKIIGVK